MSRGVDSTLLTALQGDAARIVHLLALELDDGTVYVTSARRDIAYDGNTYTALGHFLSISDIDESTRLNVNDCTVELSGVDQVYIASVLGETYINRRAKLWWAAVDAADALIGTPLLVIDGRMDDATIDEDPQSGASTVSVRIANIWSDFERTNGRRTNSGSQQRYFPSDLGFQYAHQAGRSVLWGRS